MRPDLKELEDVKEVWLTLPLVKINMKEEKLRRTNSSVNSTVNSSVNSTVNSFNEIVENIELTDVQKSLLKSMIEIPTITIAELSTETGLNHNAVNYQLKKLRKILNIERYGSDKKGSWMIYMKV